MDKREELMQKAKDFFENLPTAEGDFWEKIDDFGSVTIHNKPTFYSMMADFAQSLQTENTQVVDEDLDKTARDYAVSKSSAEVFREAHARDFKAGANWREKVLPIRDVSGSALIDLNTQVEILKKVIDKLMITFDNEDDRIDYILDIVNEYKKQVSEHYR